MNDIGVITLMRGGFTIVDAHRFNELNQKRWEQLPKGYVLRRERYGNGRRRSIYLHNVVRVPSAGKTNDHKNRVRWDNRECNLCDATECQQTRNMSKRKRHTSSRFKGVSWDKNRKQWEANIYDGKSKFLGYFVSEEAAAEAYNKAAIKLFGEFANPNQL